MYNDINELITDELEGFSSYSSLDLIHSIYSWKDSNINPFIRARVQIYSKEGKNVASKTLKMVNIWLNVRQLIFFLWASSSTAIAGAPLRVPLSTSLILCFVLF